MIPRLLLGLAVASRALAAPAPDKEKLKLELAKMEDAFCAMVQEKGLLAAFEYFAAPDVTFIDTEPTKYKGVEAVRRRIGPDKPGVTLTWSATFTDISDDGSLGYNYGRYERRFPGPDGKEQTRSGYFLTIWKRQPNGTWRYVMDTGVADRLPDPPPAPKKN